MNLTLQTLHRLLARVAHARLVCRRMGTVSVTPAVLALRWRRVFEDHGVPEPQESSDILIAHALGVKTIHSLARRRARSPVSAEQLAHVEKMAHERLNRVPIQYIIGEWDFLDLTLQMKPPVFIPRPETEELVGLVLAACPRVQQAAGPRILEVGCGSGAVSLALLRSLPQAHVVAIDKSEEAVKLTRHNAERLGLQHLIHIVQHDILSDPAERLMMMGPADIVVSNPPYIFTEDMSTLEPEIVRYEEHAALHGGHDGMDVMKAILRHSPLLLKPRGDIFFEGDPRHPDMLREWLTQHPELQLQLLRVVEDFCGKPRFVHIRRGDPTSCS